MIPFILLSILLGAGHLLRMKIKLLRKLYLPSCVIGGIVGLIILQIILMVPSLTECSGREIWINNTKDFFAACSGAWSKLPAVLINVVFACLFLGVKIPKLSTLWRRAGTQVAYGQIVAWGQYVVAIGLFIVLIGKFWDLPSMFAGVLPVGFEGGHGTAAGLAPTFERLNWAAGKDFALASATFGIITAITFGMILVNWAIRKGYVSAKQDVSSIGVEFLAI